MKSQFIRDVELATPWCDANYCTIRE